MSFQTFILLVININILDIFIIIVYNPDDHYYHHKHNAVLCFSGLQNNDHHRNSNDNDKDRLVEWLTASSEFQFFRIALIAFTL